MASLDAFRVFVAVYRAGTVTGAARERHLTQPAVSAQLAALEARVGERLFTRTPRGMRPTERGEQLYAQVADAVDRLDGAARDLRLPWPQRRPLRLGCPPEFLQGFVLPRLHPGAPDLHVTLGGAREHLTLLEAGRLDALLTPEPLSSRAVTEWALLDVPFVLIGPPDWPALPADAAGEWLNARPWVSYSVDLPVTRRLFTQTFGVRFAAPQALIVPDLRAVVRAVQVGLGASLTPLFAAQEALAAGQVRELLDVRALVPTQRWRLLYRPADEAQPALQALARALSAPPVRS
ncbi:LysR family transcriptional regulator [Deinococcus taeanensis]|uniref:LysR family transcriptional regulator n=1 Tax=Deinococcus taeanensis TaxID=2737050 RepID=UPI001CDD61AC|nr:LysR family transcriptional regulator [Deinococcus taeanensis]UBV42365.1 LysR family transcriptional regulator [Deinococcus taeanensis]